MSGTEVEWRAHRRNGGVPGDGCVNEGEWPSVTSFKGVGMLPGFKCHPAGPHLSGWTYPWFGYSFPSRT